MWLKKIANYPNVSKGLKIQQEAEWYLNRQTFGKSLVSGHSDWYKPLRTQIRGSQILFLCEKKQ